MSLQDRPSDFFDQPSKAPRVGKGVGWLQWGWRQLTSMRTALLLLLLLALAAVPGSLFPQRSSDPNGVIQFFRNDPDRAQFLDGLGLFSVYSSPWFSAVYILLFISLVGCVIPRTAHHWRALRQEPPLTPRRLDRLSFYSRVPATLATGIERLAIVEKATRVLRRKGYRVRVLRDNEPSVSAERGYWRETGNLVFHVSLIGVLLSLGIVAGFGFVGQRVVVEGESFGTNRAAFDSFNSGRFFTENQIPQFSVSLDDFAVTQVDDSIQAFGFITDYRASVRVSEPTDAEERRAEVRVNEPISVAGTEIYLMGNGYAPTLVVRNPEGEAVFSDSIPFLPQDANLTSLGVIKVPDGLDQQVGMVGFFYPTQGLLESGAYTSVYADLENPVVTLNVFIGDLGVDDGTPRSVYALDTSGMTQLTGGDTGIESLELRPGESAPLPNGLGTVELLDIPRFASFDVAYDPSKIPVLISTSLVLVGLALALFVPRRRVWVRITPEAIEYGALARGDDPGLDAAMNDLSREIDAALAVNDHPAPTEGRQS